jgi:hypothetical protein
MALLGCGKPKSPEIQPTPAQEPPLKSRPIESTPVASPPSPSAAPPAGTASVTESDEPGLTALNRAINAYVMGQLKAPQTLDDLVKAGLIKRLPTAPPGKKYALDATKTGVVMVDR